MIAKSTWALLLLLLAACGDRPAGQAPTSVQQTAARSFTVVAAGDVLLHDRLQEQAKEDAGGNGYDFVPMMEAVRPVVESADLAICHMETPIAAPEGPFAGYPVFKVPPQIIPDLRRMGWDACSTASNHSIDDGEAGVQRTLDALDAQGMAHAGTARSAAEQAAPTLVTVNGIRIGLLSYTFGLNGLVPPAGKQWLANVIDPDAIRGKRHAAGPPAPMWSFFLFSGVPSTTPTHRRHSWTWPRPCSATRPSI